MRERDDRDRRIPNRDREDRDRQVLPRDHEERMREKDERDRREKDKERDERHVRDRRDDERHIEKKDYDKDRCVSLCIIILSKSKRLCNALHVLTFMSDNIEIWSLLPFMPKSTYEIIVSSVSYLSYICRYIILLFFVYKGKELKPVQMISYSARIDQRDFFLDF